MNIIKPTAAVLALTTANTVSNSPIVYVASTVAATITVANSSGTIGSFMIPANQYVFVQKNPTDTIAANVAVQVTPAAYKG